MSLYTFQILSLPSSASSWSQKADSNRRHQLAVAAILWGAPANQRGRRERLRYCSWLWNLTSGWSCGPYPLPNLAAQCPVLVLLGLGVPLAAGFWVSRHLLVCTLTSIPLKQTFTEVSIKFKCVGGILYPI